MAPMMPNFKTRSNRMASIAAFQVSRTPPSSRALGTVGINNEAHKPIPEHTISTNPVSQGVWPERSSKGPASAVPAMMAMKVHISS